MDSMQMPVTSWNRRIACCLAAALAFACLRTPALGAETDDRVGGPEPVHRICKLIQHHAELNDIPREFFARLIWKESRFDANAVSPAGAEGIAQFMPGTARLRGLQNPFDAPTAIAASAKYLGEMKRSYGNLGLAAAAYNAGENRVARWLSVGGFLPVETENYVLDIMGEPADNFADSAHTGTNRPLEEKRSFAEACRRLPVIQTATIPMASVHTKPWGVQLAGNFRRSAALQQWERIRGRYPSLLNDYEPVVSRKRMAFGPRAFYIVRIGIDNRTTAYKVCAQLRSVGGSCAVLRNR
ncbi:MAG: lytic transglycosylase domain-containing protein [Rhizobiaceae bacterium]|nr:lytic transglycosylase domain-containing protein [Rhizobiaceae bacterium]